MSIRDDITDDRKALVNKYFEKLDNSVKEEYHITLKLSKRELHILEYVCMFNSNTCNDHDDESPPIFKQIVDQLHRVGGNCKKCGSVIDDAGFCNGVGMHKNCKYHDRLQTDDV